MKSAWLVLVSAVGVLSIKGDNKGFDSSVLFRINWPGSLILSDNPLFTPKKKEIIKVTTSQKEKYEWDLPELQAKESTGIEDYEGASPIDLLKPLFSQKICSYRLESYWSYEVCHGRYIRQYHEEQKGKHIQTYEYFLGHWRTEKQAKLEEEWKAAQNYKATPKKTKVEGLDLPYFEMVMDEGIICDLGDQPRLTRVLYVCCSHGKHEVYSFKETSICEYKVIILSPLLCEHPKFKPKDVGQNIINYVPLGGAPIKPRNLLKHESQSRDIPCKMNVAERKRKSRERIRQDKDKRKEVQEKQRVWDEKRREKIRRECEQSQERRESFSAKERPRKRKQRENTKLAKVPNNNSSKLGSFI